MYRVVIKQMDSDHEIDSAEQEFDSKEKAEAAFDDLSADLECIGREHGVVT